MTSLATQTNGQKLFMKKNKSTGHNSTFAIGGASCSADSFVITESAVLRMNILC